MESIILTLPEMSSRVKYTQPPLKDVMHIVIRNEHKYLTVVMDLHTERVIFVGDGRVLMHSILLGVHTNGFGTQRSAECKRRRYSEREISTAPNLAVWPVLV